MRTKKAGGEGRKTGNSKGKPRSWKIKSGSHKDRLDSFYKAFALDLLASSPSNTAKEFAVERQLSRMRKRTCLADASLKSKAVNDFISINNKLATVVPEFDPLILGEARDFIYHVLSRHMRRLFPESIQETWSYDLLYSHWRFGPKTSFGVEGTGVVEKIDQPMTVTKLSEPYVRKLRNANLYFSSQDSASDFGGLLIVPGSRLSTVLKNEEQWRTIAVEPSGSMALQLAGAHFIEEALAAIGLNIRCQQPKNQKLAQKGSLDSSVCTIDLKSASDMRTRSLVRQLWPEEWYRLTEELRSPCAQINGVWIELNMTSTMGNGLTFPMMTLEILALIYANRRINHGGRRRFVDFTMTAVFGDDIIVPTAEYESLTKVLAGAGYVVNHDKSYSTGPFRESCGGDYFQGVDVTPCYVRSLNTIPEVYVAINQVLLWASKHEIPVFRSLRVLFSMLPGKPYFVPEWFQPTSGVRTRDVIGLNGQRKFKFLRNIPVKREYKGAYHFMLCIGGFLEQDADGDFHYSPHSEWVGYKSDNARLSLNFLDGWDPLLWNSRRSTYASLLVSLAL